MERAINLDMNMNIEWSGPKRDQESMEDGDGLYQVSEIRSEK